MRAGLVELKALRGTIMQINCQEVTDLVGTRQCVHPHFSCHSSSPLCCDDKRSTLKGKRPGFRSWPQHILGRYLGQLFNPTEPYPSDPCSHLKAFAIILPLSGVSCPTFSCGLLLSFGSQRKWHLLKKFFSPVSLHNIFSYFLWAHQSITKLVYCFISYCRLEVLWEVESCLEHHCTPLPKTLPVTKSAKHHEIHFHHVFLFSLHKNLVWFTYEEKVKNREAKYNE